MFSGPHPSSTAIARSLFLAATRGLQGISGLAGATRAFRSELGLLNFPETMTGGTGLRRHDLRGWFDHDPAP
ncbi:hypothetical protein [Labrenzia sp. OB1]|uniref:hypothetical protein n=1 Tax=Labrenzia sp. OB1 TaxID=1561204 RepID=UPI0007B264FF|nr:hypothetical protein [Labrenzia sp. OB1]KZM49190.1 hypothetical protein OA90_15580 [Labrenzia sp. OB1]